MRDLHFFLGGRDLEMAKIARLVSSALGPGAITDDGLAWGARLSHYAARIEAAVARGETTVAVELADDMPPDWPARRRLLLVDHHGARAGGPSSLEQVFTLLGLPPSAWTRDMSLVAANDIDHIGGLFRAGASAAEAQAIRARDRAAQGVTPEQEQQGARAARDAEEPLPGLKLMRLPHHRMAAAMDPLAFAMWPALPQALAAAPGEIAFFGQGAAVIALDAAFPGGWRGGNLPRNGFWGHAGGPQTAPPELDRVLAALAPFFPAPPEARAKQAVFP